MKKVILGIVGGLLVLVVVAGVIFRVNFVYMDGKIYNKNETRLYVYMPETRISELNRCKKLESLTAMDIDNEQIEKMLVFDELTRLDISNHKLEINAPEIEKINQFPKLNWLDLSCSKADLSSLRNDSITKIEFIRCELTFNDNGFLWGCPDLEIMRIYNTTINGFITSAWNKDYGKEVCTIEDSSFLSDLDSVKNLTLDTVIVEDISGILDMDSLKNLSLVDCTISEEFQKALEDKGINVTLLGLQTYIK